MKPRRARSGTWQERGEVVLLALGLVAGLMMMTIGFAPRPVSAAAPLPTGRVQQAPASVRDGDTTASGTVAAPLPPAPPAPGTRPGSAALPSTPVTSPSPDSRSADPDTNGARLEIPSLGISAPLRPAAVVDGSLALPHDPAEVGLWTDGADLTATQGTVLVAGHVASGSTHGSLWGLARIEPGTEISVGEPHRPTRWRTVTVTAHRDGDLPADLFAADGPRRLAVVTCGGDVVDGRYTHTVVVIAEAAA